jgi:hypothetical protein
MSKDTNYSFIEQSEDTGYKSLFGKIKNSKVGRTVKDIVKNISKRSFNFVKEHPYQTAFIIGGGIAAAVALCCDIVIFKDESLPNIARYYLGRKPNDINFMPPVKPYYGSPQGISIVSLNPFDAFSVYEPPIYGSSVAGIGVKHILDKPKKSKEP